MKKYLLIFVAFTLCIASYAKPKQPTKQWLTEFKAGDPMKGTQDRYTYNCMGDYGSFYYTSTNRKSFCVTAYKGILDFKYIVEVDEWRVKGKVGLYDEDGNMLKVIECPFKQTKGMNDKGWSRCSTEECEEILNYIENAAGFVRIIISRYGENDLDMKIPCKSVDKGI